MRTNTNSTVVTNCNVFGFGQDRVVALWVASCAYAAQHLASRHASKHLGRLSRGVKRRGTDAVAGADLLARSMCLAIRGPQWQPVRPVSPVLVMA